ncbi:MAG: ferredoxin--NADP reductase [Proteobacteria bacterium]|nr:ferredoxin--NADP reductase [Pseudomonadota bacterium]
MAKWLNGTVVENYHWNERLTSLKFDAPLGRFKAGQFVRVGLEIDGDIIARPYSLVNSPDESPLEIYFNMVSEGPLTPPLFQLQKGDDLLVAPNTAGFLTINEIPDTRDLWMVATGTAIGPFLSILKESEVWERFERIILCYSVRAKEELAYAESIDAVARQHEEQFCFVPLVTREQVTGTLNMRITAAIANGELERKVGTSISADHSHVMMCGSSDMIKDVSVLLESRGMHKHRRREPGHFSTEKYY